MPEGPTYITVPELARRLGRSARFVYRACQRGEIPGAFLIGRTWQINLEAFEEATATATGRLTKEAA